MSYIWLGGTDSATEGTWQWSSNDDTFYEHVSGNTNIYENWGYGYGGSEPDDYFEDVNEDNTEGQGGLAIGLENWPSGSGGAYGYAGEWNDIGTANQLFYLVQFSPVPELAQTPLIIILALSIGIIHARSRRHNFLQD